MPARSGRAGLERRALVAAAIPALLAVLGCSQPRDPSLPPNLVLVVADTLRADHLGCYGYPRNTSPHIDAFAAGATRYTRALASSPWTVPSHASMFTGKPPFAHGAHSFRVERKRNNVRRLALSELTLAEALRERGYRTAAFAANSAFLARHWQLDQGFEHYLVQRSYAAELNREVFAWLDDLDPAAPFFLFVNYMDTHAPFNARPRPEFDVGARPDGGRLDRELAERVLPGKDPVPLELVGRVVDQYDTAIANLDAALGELLERLEPFAEHSVVVFTSDHGHYFGEHHLAKHSKDVYQPVLAVPLIVRGPGQRQGREEEAPVSSYDLPRLVFSHFPEPWRGSLEAAFPMSPTDLVIAENYYTRPGDLFHPVWGHRFQRVRRAVVEWPWKLIHSSDGAHELYDLAADPGESVNLYAERADVARRLEGRLEQLGSSGAADATDEPAELDPELKRQLDALGYGNG